MFHYTRVKERGLNVRTISGFRVGRVFIAQIFTLKQIGEKAGERKCNGCGFYRFGEM